MENVLRFNLRVTKGNANWNHSVQFVEDHTVHEDLNFFKWFRLLLLQKGLDLESFKELGDRREEKLFHWNAGGAREIFADRAKSAGFPPGLFSYHSLRSGFLCSALLKAGSQQEREAVLEHTAFVAGWKVGGTSQLLYVKEAFMK